MAHRQTELGPRVTGMVFPKTWRYEFAFIGQSSTSRRRTRYMRGTFSEW
jgi:hypothetical protein